MRSWERNVKDAITQFEIKRLDSQKHSFTTKTQWFEDNDKENKIK